MEMKAMVSCAGLLLLFAWLSPSQALYFHIGETEKKCFIEEIPDETMVIGTSIVKSALCDRLALSVSWFIHLDLSVEIFTFCFIYYTQPEDSWYKIRFLGMDVIMCPNETGLWVDQHDQGCGRCRILLGYLRNRCNQFLSDSSYSLDLSLVYSNQKLQLWWQETMHVYLIYNIHTA